MRKIETQMNKAITAGVDFKSANTEVISCTNVADVYLHDNLIARIGETWIELFDGGWRTATTKSRLNAILAEHGNGDKVFQKKGEWFVTFSDYRDNKVTVPFFSGMRLNWIFPSILYTHWHDHDWISHCYLHQRSRQSRAHSRVPDYERCDAICSEFALCRCASDC